MKPARNQPLRASLAREAARLMYEEDVKQYLDAKRIAAKRLFGSQGGKRMRYRPQDLPSNGEIQACLLTLVRLHEGETYQQRLFVMRVIALETMLDLQPFKPRLIGSVSTGHVRKGSDIDIHVFSEDIEVLEHHLDELGWWYETSEVLIRKSNDFKSYTHVHTFNTFPIELSVYSLQELRQRQRSSTDGKPIVRIKPERLKILLQDEHAREWEYYLSEGEIMGLEQFS